MTENCDKTEIHPLKPFLPEGARILMLGSFPPQRIRWSMDWFYPNFQNDMWRIFGWVFFENKEYFLTQDRKSFDEVSIKDFLNRKKRTTSYARTRSALTKEKLRIFAAKRALHYTTRQKK